MRTLTPAQRSFVMSGAGLAMIVVPVLATVTIARDGVVNWAILLWIPVLMIPWVMVGSAARDVGARTAWALAAPLLALYGWAMVTTIVEGSADFAYVTVLYGGVLYGLLALVATQAVLAIARRRRR